MLQAWPVLVEQQTFWSLINVEEQPPSSALETHLSLLVDNRDLPLGHQPLYKNVRSAARIGVVQNVFAWFSPTGHHRRSCAVVFVIALLVMQQALVSSKTEELQPPSAVVVLHLLVESAPAQLSVPAVAKKCCECENNFETQQKKMNSPGLLFGVLLGAFGCLQGKNCFQSA